MKNLKENKTVRIRPIDNEKIARIFGTGLIGFIEACLFVSELSPEFKDAIKDALKAKRRYEYDNPKKEG